MKYLYTTLFILSTLLLGGCFDPNYNRPGGFTCTLGQQDTCPNDHVCCGKVCVKGPDCPQDAAVKDLRPDKNNKDGLLMVPIICSQPSKVSGNYGVQTGPSKFDMVLDRNNNPHFVFIDAAAKLRPEDPNLLCSTAVLHALRGDRETSVAYWRRAAKRDEHMTLERLKNMYVRQIMRRLGFDQPEQLLDDAAR